VLVGEAKIPIFTVFGLTYIVLKSDTLVCSQWHMFRMSFFQVDSRYYIIIFILIIILYCLLNTVNTSQIPLNQQLHIPEQLKVYLYN
jgi:hypothetical protein